MAEQQENKLIVDKQIKKLYKLGVKHYLKTTNTPTFEACRNWFISQNPKHGTNDPIFDQFIEQVYQHCVNKKKKNKI